MVAFFKLSMFVASGAPTESYTMTSSLEETYESYRKEYPTIVLEVFDKDRTIRSKTGTKSATRFQRNLETILGKNVYAFIILVLKFRIDISVCVCSTNEKRISVSDLYYA